MNYSNDTWDSKTQSVYVSPASDNDATDIKARKAGAKTVADHDHNTKVQSELQALDIKRIRPLAEGDTEYLSVLNEQARVLRTSLRRLA